jgi:hypothetical protein
MPTLKSEINTQSDEFRANRSAMQALVADLQAKRAEAAIGGPENLRDWSCRSWRPSASTRATSTAPGSSPA